MTGTLTLRPGDRILLELVGGGSPVIRPWEGALRVESGYADPRDPRRLILRVVQPTRVNPDVRPG